MSATTARGGRLTELLSVNEIASLLGVDPSAVSHKLAGRRPWRLNEAQVIAEHVRLHLDPTATIEILFGGEAA